jgi:hypothetical protein
MSKDLSKKLRDYILKMAYKTLPFGGDVWDSSAQNLSNDLKAMGVNFSKKLFWKYKLPDNLSPQEFQDKIALERFCKGFYSDFMSRVLSDKNLTGMDKIQIVRFVWEMRRKKNHHDMKYYMNEIKRNNPELANINPKNPQGFVYGALFGFAPDEIKYFCDMHSVRDMGLEDSVDKKLKQFGIDTTYVLAPSTATALIAELNKRDK